jgi:GNAT superfamily N-acetyltransferase
MPCTFRSVDLDDDRELGQIAGILMDDETALYGGAEGRSASSTRLELTGTKYWDVRSHVALDEAGDVVALAQLFIPQAENLDQVIAAVTVAPSLRGQGIGGAVLGHLVPLIRETGRPVVAAWPVLPVDGDDSPGARLCARLGLTRRAVAAIRACPLPVPDEALEALEAEVDARIGDYRVELWEEGIPDEHIDAFCVLKRQLDEDDPSEDYENQTGDYTPERLRVAEERLIASGKRRLLAVAFAPDGAIVGNSEIHHTAAEGTTFAHQEDTVVMPEHRGHRLGSALKVATHRRISDVAPHLQRLITYNSHINAQMISINERLGYRLIAREAAYQGRLG